MDPSMNKENNVRSSQDNTAKRLSVDTNNTSTLQAARPVLQEIETLSNERVLIEEFGTSFQRDGKDITFVDIQSNITADPFFSPNASYDPLGTCSQTENFNGSSLAYSVAVEEDLFYSIEYIPETQAKYLTVPFDGDQNNVTFDTTESSRIFGMPSNADSCNIESFSVSSEVGKVKDSTVNLDPRNLNVTFEKALSSYTGLTEEPTTKSPLKNSCHDTEIEDKVKIVDSGSEPDELNESFFNKSQKALNMSKIREKQNQSEFRDEIVENSEVGTEDCDMEVQTVNPDCSDNIFNPFHTSSDSDIDSVHADDEILQEEVAEVEEDMNINCNSKEAKELEYEARNPDDDKKESESDIKCDLNKKNLEVEIMKDQKEEAEVVACCAALENLSVSSSRQQEESTESTVESSIKSSDQLQVSISKLNSPDNSKSNNGDDDALRNEEEAKQHEVLNISQVDDVNTEHVCKQTEDNENVPFEVRNIQGGSHNIPQTNTEITNKSSTEEPSAFSQIENKVIPTVENDLESKKALEALSQSVNESIDSSESATVTELDTTEQILNKTIENFKEPVIKTKVHCRPNIRSLRQKTQVIAHPLIVKAVPMDNVISDSRVKEFNEKELQLRNELDKLQVELTEIQKENEIKDKCILANVLAMEANRDILAKYKTAINHYQTFVNKQNCDLVTVRGDTEQLEKEFSNMEMAFADVFNKYEKAKLTIEAFKQNEEILNKNIQGVEKQVVYMDDKCKELQNNYEQTVKQVQDRVNQERETNQLKLLNLRTSVKRLEIMASSLEIALKQKTEECQALAAFCEDIGKI